MAKIIHIPDSADVMEYNRRLLVSEILKAGATDVKSASIIYKNILQTQMKGIEENEKSQGKEPGMWDFYKKQIMNFFDNNIDYMEPLKRVDSKTFIEMLTQLSAGAELENQCRKALEEADKNRRALKISGDQMNSKFEMIKKQSKDLTK